MADVTTSVRVTPPLSLEEAEKRIVALERKVKALEAAYLGLADRLGMGGLR